MGDRLIIMENSIKKLTPAIIEACMDRDDSELFGRSDEDILSADIWAELEAFNECVLSSEKVRLELFGIARALYEGQATRIDSVDIAVRSLQDLIKAGKVTEWHLQVIEQVCRQFFFLGWHGRGAVEQAEQLRQLTGV